MLELTLCVWIPIGGLSEASFHCSGHNIFRIISLPMDLNILLCVDTSLYDRGTKGHDVHPRSLFLELLVCPWI